MYFSPSGHLTIDYRPPLKKTSKNILEMYNVNEYGRLFCPYVEGYKTRYKETET